MADVTQPGIPQQIALIAGLRWRLLHNNLRKKQNRLDFIGLLVLGAVAAIFVLGVAFAFCIGAYGFVSARKDGWLGLLFWSVFLWWQLFPIIAAGFGVTFEFRKLLRFPLSLTAFYIIGFAYGLADFTAAAGLCWLAAIFLGAAAAKFTLLPALLVVSVLFVLFNVTLERLVGSWLERVLARRRGREIFFVVFILLTLSLQLLGPIMNSYGNSAGPVVAWAIPYLKHLPASLAGRAVEAASLGDLRHFLLDTLWLVLYAAVFSALLWMRFAAQFRGEELSETAAAAEADAQSSALAGQSTLDRLPLFSPQVAAVIRKEFRYLVRNGFTALMLLLPPILVFGLVTQASIFRFTGSHPNVSLEMFFPGLVGYIMLILMAPAYNSFAYENKGVQSYFTAPVRFREILVGKNFVQIGLILLELSLCIVAFIFRVGRPSMPTLAATLAAIVFTVIGQLTIANWSSLSFPRKLAFGQVHGQRQSGMAVLVAFASQLLLFGISALVFGLGRWAGDRWLPAKAFALLAAAAIAGYVASLDPLSSYAETKKEKIIEALCR